jgi:hypothetical protein
MSPKKTVISQGDSSNATSGLFGIRLEAEILKLRLSQDLRGLP